jgi:hypothetical protein
VLTDQARVRNEEAHLRAECALRDHPTLGRWLRQQPTGRLVLDKTKVKAEERLDGKYLLATCDPDISAEDTAQGYKALLETERGFRDIEVQTAAAPGLPPPGAPHPRSRPDLPARPAPGPGRRTHQRANMAPDQPRNLPP